MAEVYASLADRAGSLRVSQAHVENDLRMIELDPKDPQLYLTISVYSEELSDGLSQFNRREESAAALSHSFEWIEKAIALQQAAPFSLQGQVLLVGFSMEKAALLHRMGKDDEALAVYQAASDLSQQTFYADKTLLFAFNHASRIHRYMGDIYAERGDWQKYLECSEFSMNWILDNRENRALWAGGLAPTPTFYLARVAIGLNKLGQKEAAIAKMDEAMKSYDQQIATHDNHGEDVIYAGETLIPASDFYVETNQISKAVRVWDKYIDMVNPFVARNPEDTSSLGYLSFALERKGDALAIYQQEHDTFVQNDTARLRAALASYQEALQRRQRILQLDPSNQTHQDAEKEVTLKISRLSAKLK
jgi:tetratricopeptide (TPR) repeat protein